MPILTLDNYMFVAECMIGTQTSPQVLDCIFDTSTSISSTFATNFYTYSVTEWNPATSTTAINSGVAMNFNSIGMNWQGYKYTDTFCLGGGDIHTTVCLEDQPFVVISKELSETQFANDPPLKKYESGNVNTIFGLGFNTQADPLNSYSFLNSAYEGGYVAGNIFTFQGVSSQSTGTNA